MFIGHKKIWNFLTQSVVKDRLSHAYLFVGPSRVGKKKVALEFIKLLECSKPQDKAGELSACGQCPNCVLIAKGFHPDILVVEVKNRAISKGNEQSEKPTKSDEIKIEQIRELQHQLSLSPFSAPRKVVIIDDAERMTQEAANCLLKTLEEPSQKSLLILISSAWHRLLPTIISRCQMIRFLPVKQDLIQQGLEKAGFKDSAKIRPAVRLACGRPGAAIKLLEEPRLLADYRLRVEEFEKLLKKDLVEKFKYVQKLSQDAASAQETLGQRVVALRDAMLSATGNAQLAVLGGKEGENNYSPANSAWAIKKIIEAQNLIGDSSFNSRLILENLMIKLLV